MLQQRQITVQTVYPPKPGKQNGTVVDATGTRFSTPAHLIPQFQQGQTYTIGWQTRSFNDRNTGELKTYNALESIVGGAPPNTQAGDPGWGAPQAPQQPVQPGAQPSPAPGNGGNKDEAMFVVGVVGRAMGSGQFGADAIINLTVNAVAAYKAWKKHGELEQGAPGPDVPF